MEVVSDNSPAEGEARAWLNAHKEQTGQSWPQLSRMTDVAASTLSAFAGETYTGNNIGIAAKVQAYRDRLASQAELGADAPIVPDWYDTPTAKKVTNALRYAQSGEMVLIVTPPGIGKTKAAQRFAAHDPNVWLATMAPSAAGVATMLTEIAEAVGLGQIKGSPQQLSRQIKARVRGKSGLIIVDEAQELTDKALNELRHIHDLTQVGVAIMGNESVVGMLDGRKTALAQISSRIAKPIIIEEPGLGDLEALLDAWRVMDADQRDFLIKLGRMPGALRTVTQTLKSAAFLSWGAGKPLSLAYLREAAKERSFKARAK